tara:strand:+ start:3588 stop:4043 length:456 start_codon:yes stop_codon:yes gene_type:complete
MPLFDYNCGDHVYQELFLPKEEVPKTIKCPVCGEESKKMVPTPAFTPGRWGDQTGKFGVNGFYDRGLGASYHTSMERERIMDAKGLASCSDLDKYHVEDAMEKTIAKNKQQDTNIATYKANIKKFGGDKSRAVGETFSVSEMQKQGTLVSE